MMDNNKAIFFEMYTRKLLDKISLIDGLSRIERIRAKNLTLLFRDSFKLDSVKYETFFPRLGDDYKKLNYDADAFCRSSSCAFSQLMGGGTAGWQLMYIDELWTYGPHCYIQHLPTKTILDLTADQYTIYGQTIPYYLGTQRTMLPEDKADATRFFNAVMNAASHTQE